MNKKTTIKLGLAVIIMGFLTNILFGCGADSQADIPVLINSGALVIDVRSAAEFSGGHIDQAINIPHNTIDKTIAKYTTDKAKAIIVYCRSGGRSAAAKMTLEKMGYTNVTNGGSLSRMQKVLNK